MTSKAKKHAETSPPAALQALERAAAKALELGRRSKTPVYVLDGGQIVDLTKPRRKPAGKRRTPSDRNSKQQN